MKAHEVNGEFAYNDLELSDIIEIYRTKQIPRFYNVSGYGSKIPTQYMIKTIDNRLHRVYCVCYSNTGSLYIRYKNINMVMVESAMLDYDIKNHTYSKEYPYI